MSAGRGCRRLLLGTILLLAGSGCADDAARNAGSVVPLAPGAKVPSVSVQTVQGDPVDLAALVREQGALLVFYRGGW